MELIGSLVDDILDGVLNDNAIERLSVLASVDVVSALHFSGLGVTDVLVEDDCRVVVHDEVQHVFRHKIVHVLFPDLMQIFCALVQVVLKSNVVELIDVG